MLIIKGENSEILSKISRIESLEKIDKFLENYTFEKDNIQNTIQSLMSNDGGLNNIELYLYKLQNDNEELRAERKSSQEELKKLKTELDNYKQEFHTLPERKRKLDLTMILSAHIDETSKEKIIKIPPPVKENKIDKAPTIKHYFGNNDSFIKSQAHKEK